MENPSRNLMILYAIVALLSIAGVALNIIPIFNLKYIEDPKLTEEVAQGLTKGLYIVALLYFVITLTSLGVIIRKRYSKSLLILLVVLLVVVFVFGQFIFDLFISSE